MMRAPAPFLRTMENRVTPDAKPFGRPYMRTDRCGAAGLVGR